MPLTCGRYGCEYMPVVHVTGLCRCLFIRLWCVAALRASRGCGWLCSWRWVSVRPYWSAACRRTAGSWRPPWEDTCSVQISVSPSHTPVSLSHARVSLSRTPVSLGHYRVAITADRWTTAFLPPWEDTWSLQVSITPMITISYHHANSDRGCRRRNGQGCLVKELDGVGWGWGNILCRLK